MPIPNFLANIFSNGGANIISSVSDIIKDFKATPEQQAALTSEINRHIETMSAQVDHANELYLKDVADARAMQIEALKQTDGFSKRFIYFFAATIVVLTIGYDFCLFFVKFPPENKDILNMVAGMLNTSCLVMVVSFFFGSSKGSEDKSKQISDMINSK